MKKNSLEEYSKKFFAKYGTRYTPLNYAEDKNSLEIRCNTCGDTIKKLRAGNLIYSKYQAYICKKCDLLYRQRIEFEKRKNRILDDSFEFIEEYKGKGVPINLFHCKCDNISKVNPDRFLDNFSSRNTKYCSCCSPSKALDTSSFTEQLSRKSNGKLQLIGEYRNAKEVVSFLCTECGNISKGIADNVIRRLTCPICDNTRGQYKQKTYHEIIDGFYQKNNKHEYQILDDIKMTDQASTKESITIKHIPCGKSTSIAPYILSSYTCKECSKRKWQDEMYAEFKKNVSDITDGEYELISGVYENNSSKMRMRHVTCKWEFDMSKNAFISGGHRCPFCKSSKGEKIVDEILKECGCNYLHGKKLFTCVNPRNGKPLEMDFQILNEKDQLIALVEYDGKQHFNKDSQFGSSKTKKCWEETVYRDNVRNQYAKDKGIPLLRIPYIYKTKEEILPLIRCLLKDYVIPEEVTNYYGKYEFTEYLKE